MGISRRGRATGAIWLGLILLGLFAGAIIATGGASLTLMVVASFAFLVLTLTGAGILVVRLTSSLDSRPCPHCGSGVAQDRAQCPHCGRVLAEADASA
jgi:uncharacterized protein (DUF58 family)